MPAYLKFYELTHSPFEGESRSKVVLGTKALRDALATIRSGLEGGAARICVNGRAGLGKTSLARALPKLLEGRTRTAVILDPTKSWQTIRVSIARQWRLDAGGLARSHLLALAREERLVVVVDRAEAASTDLLDHLDVLLSYHSEEGDPVVQSVLFADLSTGPQRDPAPVIWWLDRIQTLELQFAPLPRGGVGSYIAKHMKRAGWGATSLFADDAALAIHGYTGGIPAEIDRVGERLLTEAANRNLRVIDACFVEEILDTAIDEASDSVENDFQSADREDETGDQMLESTATRKDISGLEPEPEPADIEGNPTDASLIELEAYLSRPPSEEELRALRGNGILRFARTAAALALVVAFATMALIWFDGDPAESDARQGSRTIPDQWPNSLTNPTLFAGPNGLTPAILPLPVLARLHGPVRDPDPTEPAPDPKPPFRSLLPGSDRSPDPRPVRPTQNRP